MTASKLIPRTIANKLLAESPATALDVALEVVKLISKAHAQSAADGSMARCGRQRTAADELVAAVCRHYSVNEGWLRSRHKHKHVIRPRHVAWALIRWQLGYHYAELGEMFDRDHTTIMHGVSSIDREDADVLQILKTLDAGAEAAE